jgi:hypothetical protein
MRKLPRTFITVVATLALGGCLVYNSVPLSPPGSAAIDTALLGGWDSKPETDPGIKERLELDISRDGEHALLVAVTSYEGDGSTREHVYHGHGSVHGERRYLNLYATENDRNLRGYITARYRIDGEALAVELLDVPATRTAIQTGGLEGMVSISAEYGDVTVTAEGESLASYLERNPSLFGKPIEFVRRK